MNAIRTVWRKLRRRLGSVRRELRARSEARAAARARARAAIRDSRSSVTNRKPYLDLCTQAAADDRVFESFRRQPIYVNMLEHVTETDGAAYLAAIRRDNPHLLGERLEAFRANDRFGSPETYEYPGIGRISPVTLRYLKVLSDLELLFGDLTGKRIVEIGSGYGGQARLVLERWAVRSYTLIDLGPALRLARRYLARSGDYKSLSYLPPRRVKRAGYDLCISNYAFSELGRKIQDSYAKSVVSSSDRGYLTCNFNSGIEGIDSWPREKLEELHSGTRWIPEEPLTFEGNAILVWGDIVGGSAGETPSVAHARS